MATVGRQENKGPAPLAPWGSSLRQPQNHGIFSPEATSVFCKKPSYAG
jgi:hypothetical protein